MATCGEVEAAGPQADGRTRHLGLRLFTPNPPESECGHTSKRVAWGRGQLRCVSVSLQVREGETGGETGRETEGETETDTERHRQRETAGEREQEERAGAGSRRGTGGTSRHPSGRDPSGPRPQAPGSRAGAPPTEPPRRPCNRVCSLYLRFWFFVCLFFS